MIWVSLTKAELISEIQELHRRLDKTTSIVEAFNEETEHLRRDLLEAADTLAAVREWAEKTPLPPDIRSSLIYRLDGVWPSAEKYR